MFQDWNWLSWCLISVIELCDFLSQAFDHSHRHRCLLQGCSVGFCRFLRQRVLEQSFSSRRCSAKTQGNLARC